MSHPPFSTTFRVNFKLQAAWVPAVGGGGRRFRASASGAGERHPTHQLRVLLARRRRISHVSCRRNWRWRAGGSADIGFGADRRGGLRITCPRRAIVALQLARVPCHGAVTVRRGGSTCSPSLLRQRGQMPRRQTGRAAARPRDPPPGRHSGVSRHPCTPTGKRDEPAVKVTSQPCTEGCTLWHGRIAEARGAASRLVASRPILAPLSVGRP